LGEGVERVTVVVAQDLFGNSSYWRPIIDGDSTARALADRHYSRKTVGAPLFVGPGKKLVLLGADGKALFVWRQSIYRLDGQKGVECTIFRNEGPRLSSELICEAMEVAWQVWPGARLFTYVDASKIRSKNPGCCFKKAGWRRCGKSKGGLVVLECRKEWVG
jgi:hypothetical protein